MVRPRHQWSLRIRGSLEMVEVGARRRSRAKLLYRAGTALVFGLGATGAAYGRDVAAARDADRNAPAAQPPSASADAAAPTSAEQQKDRSTIYVTGTRVIRN